MVMVKERGLYGPIPVPTPSPDIEMAVDVPEVKEIAFTLITNQKHKGKGKVSSSLSGTLPDSRSKILLVLRAPPLPKTMTTCPATTISKTIQAQMAPLPVPLAFKPKSKVKLFAQAVIWLIRKFRKIQTKILHFLLVSRTVQSMLVSLRTL